MQKLSFDYDTDRNAYVAYVGGDDDETAAYRVLMEHDDDAESPRGWSNACVMVCEHRRYNLGDYKNGHELAREAIRASRFYRPTWEDTESGYFQFGGQQFECLDLYDAAGLWTAIQLCDDIEAQALYLYDHSGLSISTSAFSCPWDSGQVGFAFVDKAKLAEMTGKARWTPALRKWARDAIESETSTYDDYLCGNVYGYIVERAPDDDDERDDDDSWEHVGSCWGFYGDETKSGLAEQALDEIRHDIAERKASRTSQLKAMIRANAPLHARAVALAKLAAL